MNVMKKLLNAHVVHGASWLSARRKKLTVSRVNCFAFSVSVVFSARYLQTLFGGVKPRCTDRLIVTTAPGRSLAQRS